MTGRVQRTWLWGTAFALVAAVLAVFWQTADFGFLNYDDPLYVTKNPHVKAGLTGASLRWALTAMHDANWFPLTWLSHMLTVEFFGMRAGAHHMVSVVHHAVNSALLLFVMVRLTGALWRSALVAALFALHPLHVESVAWIAERKDVLSAFFFFLALYAWCRYVERPGVGRYVPVAALFACGLMAKPMLVTLPCVLLLLDVWPLRRCRFTVAGSTAPALGSPFSIGRLVLEKIPLLLISAASSVGTYIVQQKGGGVEAFGNASLVVNAGNAAVSYLRYLGKMLWPKGLAVLYPHGPLLPRWHMFGAALVIAVLTAGVVWQAQKRPYLAVGWFWYLGMMVPVIGLVRIGFHAIADRYTYLPFIGLFIIAAWGLGEVAEKFPRRQAVIAGGAIAITLVLAAVSWVQVGHWRNSTTLYRHTLAVTDKNWVVHNNLASVLLEEGSGKKVAEACAHLTQAICLKPDYAIAYGNLGRAFQLQAEPAKALAAFRQALQLDPQLAFVHFNIGIVLADLGQKENALATYRVLQPMDGQMAETLLNFINSR